MSDFETAVTAVGMAIDAFGLDGKITVKMDSERQHIILDHKVTMRMVNSRNGPEWETRGPPMGGVLALTEDVVDAVVEAMAQVIAQQARGVLYDLFEAVEGDED